MDRIRACPVCDDELDDGYCHDCEHSIYDQPEFFITHLLDRIKQLKVWRTTQVCKNDIVYMKRAMECPNCKEVELLPVSGSRGEMYECNNCGQEVQF